MLLGTALGIGFFVACGGVSRDPLAGTGGPGGGGTGAFSGGRGMTDGTGSANAGEAGDWSGLAGANDAGAGRSTGGSATTNTGGHGAGRGGFGDGPESGSGGAGGAVDGGGAMGGDGGAGDGGAGDGGTGDASGGINASGGISATGGLGGLGGTAGGGGAGKGAGGSGDPEFELVTASGSMQAIVECPADKPWVLGTGAQGIAGVGFQAVVPEPSDEPDDSGLGTNTVRVEGGTAGTTKAYAVCSEVMGIRISGSSSPGSRTFTAECGSGMVTIGGGGECTEGEKLVRSRPVPDTDGSTPTGWMASCTTGLVTTYAMCIMEDFKDCHTERVDTIGSALVGCPAGQTAMTAGAYCGGGDPQGLLSMELSPDLTRVSIACVESTASVFAYAICCG